MARRGVSRRELARQMGVHFTVVSHWSLGSRLPGRENAVKLYRLTGILIESWSPTPVAESRKADKTFGRKSFVDKGKMVHG